MIKYCILPLLCFSITTVHATAVNLSGVVKNSKTNVVISGADVKLKKLGMSTITNSEGTFGFTKTSVNLNADGPHVVRDGNLTFSLESDGNVNVRISDLSGKVHSTLSYSKLQRGTWKLVPPSLQSGLYVCTFKTDMGQHSVRYLVSEKSSTVSEGSVLVTGAASNMSHSNVMTLEKLQASTIVDTIVVTKSGYKTANYAITSYSKSDLSIALDEESVNSDDATIVPDPSWTCFMPNGIPPPELGTKVFTIKMQYQTKYDVGRTKFGTRRFFDVKGGTIDGSKLKGTLYSGGLDLELTLSNGSTELEQIIIIKTNDSKPILMRNAGVAPSGTSNVRVVLDFEAPNSSSYTWLHTGKFAATRIVDTVGKTISMDVYDISNVTLPATKVQIKDPSGVTNQTWECLKFTGATGNTVITENVSLGASISIGSTKGGSRNIIPITGGTTTGKVVGNVLNGGADYQMGGLDARYTLAPNDGEFILVRNCGSNGLVPVFEARADGPYAFLNENKFVSSGPQVGGSGVKIVFSEMK